MLHKHSTTHDPMCLWRSPRPYVQVPRLKRKFWRGSALGVFFCFFMLFSRCLDVCLVSDVWCMEIVDMALWKCRYLMQHCNFQISCHTSPSEGHIWTVGSIYRLFTWNTLTVWSVYGLSTRSSERCLLQYFKVHRSSKRIVSKYIQVPRSSNGCFPFCYA